MRTTRAPLIPAPSSHTCVYTNQSVQHMQLSTVQCGANVLSRICSFSTAVSCCKLNTLALLYAEGVYCIRTESLSSGNNSGKSELIETKFYKETQGHVARSLQTFGGLRIGADKTHFANFLSPKQRIVSPTSRQTISVQF